MPNVLTLIHRKYHIDINHILYTHNIIDHNVLTWCPIFLASCCENWEVMVRGRPAVLRRFRGTRALRDHYDNNGRRRRGAVVGGGGAGRCGGCGIRAAIHWPHAYICGRSVDDDDIYKKKRKPKKPEKKMTKPKYSAVWRHKI